MTLCTLWQRADDGDGGGGGGGSSRGNRGVGDG